MDKNKIIKEFVDFVEGRMDFDTFWYNYQNNKNYYRLLDDKNPGEEARMLYRMTVNQCIAQANPNTISGKCIIHKCVRAYLRYYKVPFNSTEEYQKKLDYLYQIQPNYIEIDDEDFLNKIIEKAPKELKKGEKKKWIKNYIKEMFKYDVKPPRWIQFPEWPIINGKPLVFKSQTKERKDDERVYYTFYDPDTLEEKVIIQFYQ